MGATLRLLAVAPLMAVVGFASYQAVRYGVSGTASGNAMRELSHVARADGVTGAGSWWEGDLNRAAREVPMDPALRELQAVATMRDTSEPASLGEAQRNLVAAIEARPGSGYTWANLAEVKYKLGDTGPAFEKALVNAVALAPFEPEVQRTVVNYGLAVMNEVAPATRAAIERAVAAGMKRNAPETLQIAARRGRLDAACRHLDGVPRPAASKWTQLCQSMEATS